MTTKSNKPGDAATLRRQAEEKFAAKAGLPQKPDKPLSVEESQAALHELGVHQIELEMQNEELRRAQLELDTARERYFDLYDLAPVGYCTVSEEGLILESNLTMSELLGISKSVIVQSPLSRFIIKEDQDANYLHHKRLFAGDGKQDFDLRMLKTDGTVFWAHMAAVAAWDTEGTLVARVVLSDISKAKQTEEALSESQNRFSLFMEYLPASVFVKDHEGRALFTNRYMDESLGSSRWLGKTMFEVFPNEFGAKLLADDMNVMKSGYQRFEQSFSHLDGSLHIYDVSKFVITRPGQEPLLGGVALDITERKSAEDKQRASEEKWHRLFDISPVGISVLDDKRNITDFNSSLGKILGITGEGLRSGQYLKRKYLHRDGTPFLPAEFPSSRAIAEQTNIGPVEIGVVKEDGTVVWTEVTSAPLPDSECITITANMTERKQIALQLAESKALTDAVIENVPLMVFRLVHTW